MYFELMIVSKLTILDDFFYVIWLAPFCQTLKNPFICKEQHLTMDTKSLRKTEYNQTCFVHCNILNGAWYVEKNSRIPYIANF